MFNSRILFLAVFVACTLLLVTAIYIEPFKSMNPCPMCMMQRAVFVVIALLALIAAVHNAQAWGHRLYSGLILLVSMLGAGIAGRQIWLQNLPEDQVPACGPGLEYMLEVFPLLEVIQMAIQGTGDCAEVQWVFLGLSIPGWSLLAFVGIAVLMLGMMISKKLNPSA